KTQSYKSGRESLAIADQSLDVIQGWGEAFLPRRQEFPLFVQTYHELRAEGLPFSEQYQSDRPPVLDPGAGSLLDRPSSATRRAAASAGGGTRAGAGGGGGGSSTRGSSRRGGGGTGGGGEGSPELSPLS
ncbi:unnamed protein product, partial [Laminaria digitata]